MTDSTQKLTLFRCIAEDKLNLDLITEGDKQVVSVNSMLYGDLGILIELLDRAGFTKQKQQKWWVARVQCSQQQVVTQSDGRYRAKEPIEVQDGYIPLEDALVRYSGIKIR